MPSLAFAAAASAGTQNAATPAAAAPAPMQDAAGRLGLLPPASAPAAAAAAAERLVGTAAVPLMLAAAAGTGRRIRRRLRSSALVAREAPRLHGRTAASAAVAAAVADPARDQQPPPKQAQWVPDDDGIDRRDWSKELKKPEDKEKIVDGEKWFWYKDGITEGWRRDSEFGTYRYTDGGYESRGPDGDWVTSAQMPSDTSHLTDDQRARLIQELKGDIKVSLKDGDETVENFRPLAKTPPLEKWPFHQVDITDELLPTEEQIKEYRILELTEDLGRAFFLSTRWKQANEARRHLGYNVNDQIEDIAAMNGAVLALRNLVDQIKRTAKYQKLTPEEQAQMSDRARIEALECTSLLGTEKGSSCALYTYSEASKRIKVDLCLGDDCMDQGPYAEEMLLRYLAKKARERGATSMWCRTRRTESGRVFAPKYFKTLGFTPVPYELQEEEDWEQIGGLVEKVEAQEAVPSLNLWLSTRGLDKYLEASNQWCSEMGAADILEVSDNKEELADYLEEEHGLTADERERLLQY